MKLLMVAGELSGDTHGGALLEGLSRRLPGLEAFGIGGPRMAAAGQRQVYALDALQVHGLLEVLAHLPRLYRVLWHLEALLETERPQALLLIDYPGFNLKLAAAARARGIPVLYYSSPQVWAWRGGRMRTIAQVVSRMFVLFPFEVPLYERAGVPVQFLGHPLVGVRAGAGEVAALKERLAAWPAAQAGPSAPGAPGRQRAGLPIVAVMPGSRPSELERNLPPLLEGLRLAAQAGYAAHYVLPVAPSLRAQDVQAVVDRFQVPVQVVEGAFLPLLQVAELALVSSGTATLQVAMAGIPFLVVYRVAPLSYWLARRFAYVRHFSIVNILAEREVVPELIQERFTPQAVADTLLALARDTERQRLMRAALAEVTARLGEPGAYARAAEAIARLLQEGVPAPARPAGGRP